MNTLATKIRPQTIAEIVGQSHLKTLLTKVIEHQKRVSFLFFGNPGIGKTSLAIIIANELKLSYAKFNAATDTKKQLTFILATYDAIIIDEIHRLNKDKQDILLPKLESGRIVVLATTTENPYFVVNPAVRSRLQTVELKPLTNAEIADGLAMIMKREATLKIKLSKTLLKDLAIYGNGDFRAAINCLELLNDLYAGQTITKKIMRLILPTINFASDRNGTLHYDNLSAFHKSLRGSSPDGALYYLAVLIKSGDFEGIYRRLLAVVYEDVGLANPNLPLKVAAAINAFKQLGMPEGARCLAQITLEISLSKKSNAVNLALNRAFALGEKYGLQPVPEHLRDQHRPGALKKSYLFPHHYVDHYVIQRYLPTALEDEKVYQKQNSDVENKLNQWLENVLRKNTK